jgi:DNA-binding transcriptional LysR family regulator
VNWDDARIFLAFAREGSFGAAAKRLDVQHSTVSRRIHALENSLSAPLVERSPTGFVLTRAGEELRDSALRMEKEILSFEASSVGENDAATGDLHVTAIANMASSLLMPIFARFSKTHPDINLRIDVTNDSVRLSERDADVALRQTNVPGETLIGTRLTTVSSAVYGSLDYCEAVKTGKTPERWVGVDCCDYHRDWTRAACPKADYVFCVDETSVTAAALRAGLGVGYLPCFLGDTDPSLTRFREPEEKHDLGLWFLYHRDLRNTKRVTVFREHMQREIKSIRQLFEGQAN